MAGSKMEVLLQAAVLDAPPQAARRCRGGQSGRQQGADPLQGFPVGSPGGDELQQLAGGRLAGQLDELGAHLVRPDLAQLVHRAQDRQVAFGQPPGGQEAVEQLAVGHVDAEARHPQLAEALLHEHQDLEVRRGGVRADQVEVDLDELAVAPALGVLPAPDLGHVVALEGQVQLVGVRGHEAGEGDGEVEAQGHVPLAVVPEAVDLLVRLPAALAQQDLGVLQGRGVDGHEAEAPEHAGELFLHGQAAHLRLGQGIAEAAQGLGIDDVRHAASENKPGARGASRCARARVATARLGAADRSGRLRRLDAEPALATIP